MQELLECVKRQGNSGEFVSQWKTDLQVLKNFSISRVQFGDQPQMISK